MNKLSTKRFDSIDGIRVIACICIVLMHVKANLNFSFSNDVLDFIVDQFTNFVFLFMTISAFGMCCGYYEKIKNNEISPVDFYSKRIKKLLPFFVFLIIIDLIVEHNIPSIIEGFANSTLLFNFLNKDLSVIGVAWFLGLVFMFYLLFPFFTYLFRNKKSAWFVTLIAVLMNIVSIYYFNVGRTNMFYSFVYFCVGGLIYLYKDNIICIFSKSRIYGIVFIILSIVFYFVLPSNNEYLLLLKWILLSASLVCYSISYNSNVLNNKITKYLGIISLELYLCHMVVFRALEKLNIISLFSNNLLSYICIFVMVFIGASLLSIGFNKAYSIFEKKVLKS